MGGIIGLAGGVILGPFFLSIGMLPTVVAGTNQYLALLQCISLSSQFFYLGLINIPYAAVLGVFALVGSYIGITQVNRIVKITGR